MSAPTSSSASSTPSSTSVLFARGVIARLALWPVLRVAVDQSWGGPSSSQKPTWLASDIVDAFDEQKEPAPDAAYVEDMLLQIMEDEFEVVVEDGTEVTVAEDIVKIWESITNGTDNLVKKFEQEAAKLGSKKVQVHVENAITEEDGEWEDESGDDSAEDGEDDVPMLVDQSNPGKPEPEVDEDGFTMVKGKGKGHR